MHAYPGTSLQASFLLSIGYAAFASCLLIVSYILFYRYYHELHKFPGPFLASFTNLWKSYHVYNGDFELVLREAHRKYGRIVRIGPDHLDFSDASAIKTIYGSGRTFPNRYSL